MDKFLARYMPIDVSAHGHQLDHISALVHWLMLVLFLGWSAYFVYALYRFRAKNNPTASYHGATSHFSTYTEVGVAVLEIILLIAFSIPAWYRWSSPVPNETNPLTVRVVAEQFA
ncbi:MAG TPA: cytochrome c oxidase subunit II, partial [Thermoanaerobaculia bacterium]|nr:cytochrome c oxidase subunit II [Thermoanaerobaculia bacterium]